MSSRIFKNPWPFIALIVAHLIWGANFVVAKITLQEFPPMSLAFLRFALASLFLAPFFFVTTKKTKINPVDLPKLIAIGLFIITLNITFFFEGIQRTTAINASILTLIIPGFSVLLGWWFLKEKILIVNLGGIFLGFLGSLIIIGIPQLFTGNFSPQVFLGNILIILSSVCWVIGAVVSKGMLKKYPSLIITAVGFLVGTVSLVIPASLEYLQNPAWINKVTVLGILGLMYITLLSSISAYFLFEWGLSYTTIISADLFQYVEPLLAATLSVAILNERISTSFVIGAMLITVGAYLGTLAKQIHHRYKAHRL